MDRSPQREAETRNEILTEEAGTEAAEGRWTKVQDEVARALPRLRELALQIAVVGPIFAPTSWGDGRGC